MRSELVVPSTVEQDDEYENVAEPSLISRWAGVLGFVALFSAVIWFCTPGHAHDWKQPQLDEWYSGLKRPGVAGNAYGTSSCCSKDDCHTTEAEVRKGEWWARLGRPVDHDGQRDWELEDWIKIPDEVIVRGPNGNPVRNEAGEAVICHPTVWRNYKLDPVNTTVFCFVPPDQT